MERPEGDNSNRKSVRDIVKIFGESERPIFLPKDAIFEKKETVPTIEEYPVLRDDNVAVKTPSEIDDDFSSIIEEESGSEDEVSDKNVIDGFLNMQTITDEVETFLREEENYCQLLEQLVEEYIRTLNTDNLNILEVFGRIDIISSYHNNTFLPALKKSENALKIANCFLKHKSLFSMYYESYFKNQPNMLFVMMENRDLLCKHHSNEEFNRSKDILQKAPTERIQEYQTFLETIKDRLSSHLNVRSFERALAIIQKLTQNFSKREETVRFNISEIVETERVYVQKLERITQKIIPKIQDSIRVKRRHRSVVGNVPSIYVQQIGFYEDLKKCLFEFNPNEVADCFLRHKDNFMLYVQDQQMKNDPVAMEECKEMLKKDNHRDIDFHAPLNRLYKYKLLLQELKKSCEKGELPCEQVVQALDMVSEIISQMNGTAAINSIIDENIYLYEQGKLIIRDEFVVQYKAYEYDKSIEYNAMVYLFEKSIVFTEKKTEGHTRNRRDVFIYKDHIIIKRLGIIANDSLERIIQVHFHGRSKKNFYTLNARDKVTKDAWMKEIENMLMKQLLEEKANA